jgi:16S rRNA (guanine527-N7)-methyltransferase
VIRAPSVRSSLEAVLTDAQRIGLLGPGPVARHIEHARSFGTAVEPPTWFADLGSGAGVPGLVLAAMVWPTSNALLVESQHRRIEHLRRSVAELAMDERVRIYAGRAEAAGRGEWRGRMDVVVARAFGPPAVVAECGAPLLRPGGVLLVSEPPRSGPDRWPTAGLAQLGFGPAVILRDDPPATAVILRGDPPATAVPGEGPRAADRGVGDAAACDAERGAGAPVHLARMVRTGELAARWPRMPNAMMKRPLWRAAPSPDGVGPHARPDVPRGTSGRA